MPAQLDKHAFGLRITDTVVKFAELAPVNNTFQLITFGERQLSPASVIDGSIVNSTGLADQIKTALSTPQFGHITTNHVVVSLPESRVFLKAITLPKFEKNKLHEAIMWEAKSLLPVRAEQAYYQSKVLYEEEKQVTILIAATEKKLVEGYLDLAKRLNLSPIAFDLESFAILRTIDESELSKPATLIAHISEKSTVLTVVRRGQIWFNNVLSVGTNSLIQELVQLHSLNTDEIKLRLLTGNFEALGQLNFLKTIASGIDSIITFYKQQTRDADRITTLIFSGSSASLPGLTSSLQWYLPNVIVSKAKPRLRFSHVPLKNISPLMISIGLALRGAYPAKWKDDINFLPDRFTLQLVENEVQIKSNSLLTLLGLLTLTLNIVLGSLWAYLYLTIRTLGQTIPAQTEIITKHPAKAYIPWVDDSNRLLSMISDLETQRINGGELLKRITSATPQGILIKSLVYNKKDYQLEITGIAQSRPHIFGFKQKLLQDEAIHAISIPLRSIDQDSSIEFSLNLTIDPTKL